MRVYHPHTSFFERLDLSKPPLFAFECPLDILIEPLSTPIRGISLLPVAVPSGLLNYKLALHSASAYIWLRHIYCSRLSNAIRTSSLALHSASAIFGFATYTVHASAMQFEQVRLHCIRLLRIFALNRIRTTDNRYIIYESRTFGSVACLSDITSGTSPAATTAGAESPRIRKT